MNRRHALKKQEYCDAIYAGGLKEKPKKPEEDDVALEMIKEQLNKEGK
jgi:hypothetical protein